MTKNYCHTDKHYQFYHFDKQLLSYWQTLSMLPLWKTSLLSIWQTLSMLPLWQTSLENYCQSDKHINFEDISSKIFEKTKNIINGDRTHD